MNNNSSVYEKMVDKGFDSAQMYRFYQKYDLGNIRIYPLTDDELLSQKKKIEMACIELDHTQHYNSDLYRGVQELFEK